MMANYKHFMIILDMCIPAVDNQAVGWLLVAGLGNEGVRQAGHNISVNMLR